MKKIISAILLIMTSTCSSLYAQERLRIVSEEFPPYNYTKDGELKGLSADIIKLILSDLKIDSKIEVVPWTRAYYIATNNPNVLIFTIVRTAERENLFKWGNLIAEDTTCLISKKSRNIVIKNKKDINSYVIGVTKNDVHEEILREENIRGLRTEKMQKIDIILKMLNKERIDLWASGYGIAMAEIKGLGFKRSDYHVSYVINRVEAYYAFSKDTPDETVNSFKRSFAKLRKEGKIDEITRRYFGD